MQNSKVKLYYLEKAVNFLKRLWFRSEFCKHAWMLTVTQRPSLLASEVTAAGCVKQALTRWLRG